MPRQFKYYLLFTIFFLSITWLIIPAYYDVPVTKPPGPLLDKEIRTNYQEIITRNQPTIVLIGDSVLTYSISEQAIKKNLGQEVYKLDKPGSASAIWYLLLKNNIVISPNKPTFVIIFFRGTMLTTPEYRTTGKYLVQIDELANKEDQLLLDFAYRQHMGAVEKKLDQYLPLYAYRLLVRNSIEKMVKYSFLKKLIRVEQSTLDQAADMVFGEPDIARLNAVINSAEAYLYEPDKLNFPNQLPNSFLPEIVRLTNENGIKLVVVRTKDLQAISNKEISKEFKEYDQNLAAYFTENNVTYLDYAFDERISDEFFFDALHMNKSGRSIFTDLFANDLLEILP